MKRHPTPPPQKWRLPLTEEERDLVEGCVEAVKQAVPLNARAIWAPPEDGRTGAEAQLELGLAGEPVRYAVVVQRTMRPELVETFRHFAAKWEGLGLPLLVCAERIPDKLGEQLVEAGVAYLDLGGNAYLHGPTLNVYVRGRRPVKRQRQGQYITGTQARLLGVFLRDLDAGEATQKELAARAGVALGAVGVGRKKLHDIGILDRQGERGWQVRDRTLGLRRFAEGWAAVVRNKLHPKNFRILLQEEQGALEDRLARLVRDLGCLLGGEKAADRLTHFLDTDHATLHVRAETRNQVVSDLGLIPDRNGKVTVLDRYGTGDEFEPDVLTGVPMIHPLVVWAECLTVADDRVGRVAQMLHDEYLIEAHG